MKINFISWIKPQKNEAGFKITSQRKTISKFLTSKKIKTLVVWGQSLVFLWNLFCFFIHQKVGGPYSIAHRGYNMDILFDHDQILYRISWNSFRNFGQGTLKILQWRFCLPNFLSDFVKKSSFHGIYHDWNHQFRLKMMFSKGLTNLKLKSTSLKLESVIFDGKLMFFGFKLVDLSFKFFCWPFEIRLFSYTSTMIPTHNKMSPS